MKDIISHLHLYGFRLEEGKILLRTLVKGGQAPKVAQVLDELGVAYIQTDDSDGVDVISVVTTLVDPSPEIVQAFA